MLSSERRQFELYAKLPVFRRRVERARRIIAQAIQVAAGWYVAFSGGKDSLVMLDLVLGVAAGMEVSIVWIDETFIYPETLECLEDVEQRYGIQILRVRHQYCTSREFKADFGFAPALMSDRHVDIEIGKWGELLAQQSWAGAFLGLRRGESWSRDFTLKTRGPLYQCKSDGLWHCCPLFDWTDEDVWAFIVSRNLPYNHAYDVMAGLGVPLERRRVGPLTAARVYQYGLLAVLRQGWPELFNAFAEQFPEVRAYV